MKKTSSPSSAPSQPNVNALAPVLLVVLSAALLALSLFQWMELLVVHAGGETVCAVSETVNCATVWRSPLAVALHRALGMPVAALGFVYGLVLFALSLVLVHRRMTAREEGATTFALRLASAVGIGSVVVFAVGSFSAGAVCLTCLMTYALVIGFAVVAVKLLPGALKPNTPDETKRGAVLTIATGVLAFLLVLPAGLASPKSADSAESLQKLPAPTAAASKPADTKPAVATPPSTTSTPQSMTPRESELATYLESLPLNEQMLVSRSLAQYNAVEAPVSQLPAARYIWGSANAPLHLLEWTDIRCGHCRALSDALKQIKRAAPSGALRIESRHFPLDGTCNASMQGKGPGTSCVAAKALICLEGKDAHWDIQDKLFEAQTELTPERVMEIASTGPIPRAQLQTCIDSDATASKLKDDIELALRYQLQGTPLVVLNGKPSSPIPSFLYSMAVTGGNGKSAAFSKLPAAPAMSTQGHGDDHAGHNH